MNLEQGLTGKFFFTDGHGRLQSKDTHSVPQRRQRNHRHFVVILSHQVIDYSALQTSVKIKLHMAFDKSPIA
jgi:hypothetical protein